MHLIILAVGKLKAGPERDLVSRYVDRINAIGKGLALYPLDIIELGESRARNAESRQVEEAKTLIATAGNASLAILDEKAPAFSSDEFAARIGALRDKGVADLAFVIGGADGLGAAVKAQAGFSLSFGRMTWPHQFVRIMLAEQLYRAATILAGHPYHRV